MNEKQQNDKLIENIHAQLQNSVNNIDAATQSKITQARHRALDQYSSKQPLHLWLSATAVATSCVAILIFLLYPAQQNSEPALLDEFELISNIDDMEVLEELEFYQWLDEYEIPT
jgi:hypothetical protein